MSDSVLPMEKRQGGLCLTRRMGESIVIGQGEDAVYVTPLFMAGGTVRLHTQAPSHVSVDRLEVRESKENNKEAHCE